MGREDSKESLCEDKSSAERAQRNGGGSGLMRLRFLGSLQNLALNYFAQNIFEQVLTERFSSTKSKDF